MKRGDVYGHTVGSSTKGPHQLLKKQVSITKPGFVYIYVSNESVNQRDIYFDDFKYAYSRGPIIQADDYLSSNAARCSASGG